MMERTRAGMLIFLSSEAVFFVILTLTYLFYRHSPANAGGPSPERSLDPLRTAVFTLFLLASSGTMWFAGRCVQWRWPRMLRASLLATVALGAVFLFGQGKEYLRLIDAQTTISSNVFATSFFTLTGFHGLHVLVGLIMLSILAGLAWAGDFRGPRSAAVEAISLYWHFVDAVWVVIFTVVYAWTWVLAR